MYYFSENSRKKLVTLDSRLQKVCFKVIELIDCIVLCGHRSDEEQNALFASGASKVKAGKSKHNKYPSYAVDISPYPIPNQWGANDFKERAKFYYFAGVFKTVAADCGVAIRWGGDWNGDNDFNDQTFDDLVHFELVE